MKISTIYKVLFFGFLLSSCGDSTTSNSSTQTSLSGEQQATMLQNVGVVNPVERSFNSEVSITGTAMPYQMVKVQAMESGFVQKINKDIGDYVSRGTVIATLQNPELTSKLKESEANTKKSGSSIQRFQAEKEKWSAVANAKKSILDRLERTYKEAPNIVLASDVDNARAEYESAKGNMISAEASTAAAGGDKEAAMAMVEAIRTRVDMLQVKAPFSGIITKRFVDDGATVINGLESSNAKPIVEIQNINKIRLTVQLPEADAANIDVGSEVKVSFPELSNEAIPVKVSRTSKTLDPMSKTMQVEIDINNKEGKIKPGMYAKVQLAAQNRKGRLSVPTSAKKLIDDIPYLLIIENNKVKAVKLVTGMEGVDYFEILNTEITAQSQIITQGKNLVKEGQEVSAKLIKS